MPAMNGIVTRKGWPLCVPSSSNPSAFALPFSANGATVPSMDLAGFEAASDSINSLYGDASFPKPVGELDSAPFSKPRSHGYYGSQFMDPLSSPLTRVSSPGHLIDSDDDGALDIGLLSKEKEAWNLPIFKAGPIIPIPPTSLYECNPAFSSLSWNGAPAAHSSLFEPYEALHPELIDDIDECIASYLEGPKDFHVELAKYARESCEISNKNEMQDEFGSREKDFTGLATKFSVSKHVSHNDGCYDIGEENKFMSQNQDSLCRCEDVGFNASEYLECSSSQQAENGLCSPSFIAVAPEKASAEVLAPKIDTQMLVKMMHDMSELLLGHSLKDEFLLNKQDRGMLENVISNLRACTLNSPEQMIPSQERLFPELDSGNPAGESSQLQQESHMSKVGAEHANVEQGREHRGTISDSPRICSDDPEMEKIDNVAKALKRDPSEEEESALLEAEADLCSPIYRARFTRMIEVEKYSSKHGDDNALVMGEQAEAEAGFMPRPDRNSAKEVNSSGAGRDMAPMFTQNEDGSDALESLSVMEYNTDPEMQDRSDAHVMKSDLDLEEDDEEIQPAFCLVTDDSSDWELV